MLNWTRDTNHTTLISTLNDFNIQFVLGQLKKIKTNTEISFSFWLSLFYSIPALSPHRLPDSLTDSQRNDIILCGLATLTGFLQVKTEIHNIWSRRKRKIESDFNMFSRSKIISFRNIMTLPKYLSYWEDNCFSFFLKFVFLQFKFIPAEFKN